MPDTLKARVVDLLRVQGPLSDRELTDQLLGAQAGPQPINQACRQLEAEGVIVRTKQAGARIQNILVGAQVVTPQEHPAPTEDADALSEDALKRILVRWLEAGGWTIRGVAMAHAHGIDIDAQRGAERWIIEVKGLGSRDPMRVNYFLGVLGETLQRMTDPTARYSIALPDHKQFVGLWSRLPALAKERTGITALFISAEGHVRHEVRTSV